MLTIYFLVGERQVGSDLAAGRRVLDDDVRHRVLGVLQRMVDHRPGDLHRAGVAGRESARDARLPLWIPLLWNVVLGIVRRRSCCRSARLKHLPATAAGIVASSEVLFAFVVAWLWLGEGLGPLQMIGAAIVLVGIVLAQTARAGKVIDADLALSEDRQHSLA